MKDGDSIPLSKSNGLIFSSLNAHFSFAIFLEQLCFHIFFPFSIPIFLYKFGYMNAYAQNYDLSFVVMLNTIAAGILCNVLLTVYIIWVDGDCMLCLHDSVEAQ